MSFQRRAGIVGVLISLALAVYCAGVYYSPALIVYVVEQSLIEKAPAGADQVLLRTRLQALLASIPNKNEKLARMLVMSQNLEKVQTLTRQELDQLLSVAPKPKASDPL